MDGGAIQREGGGPDWGMVAHIMSEVSGMLRVRSDGFWKNK